MRLCRMRISTIFQEAEAYLHTSSEETEKTNKNWFKWRKPQVFNLSLYIAKRKGRKMNARPLITKIFFVCGYAEM